MLKTSVAVSKPSSPATDLSSNFTQPKFTDAEFLQKKSSSIKFAKVFTVIPMLPADASGAFLAYQLLKPERLAPTVPKAPIFQPGKASILDCNPLASFCNLEISPFFSFNSFFNSSSVCAFAVKAIQTNRIKTVNFFISFFLI